jgi:transposase-like protein
LLVQSKKNKYAALKLMRTLLKKYGFAPKTFVTDELRSYGEAALISGCSGAIAPVDGETTGRRIRISRPDDENTKSPVKNSEPFAPQ